MSTHRAPDAAQILKLAETASEQNEIAKDKIVEDVMLAMAKEIGYLQKKMKGLERDNEVMVRQIKFLLEELDRHVVGPRYTYRDADIVRLHDQEHMTFKRIGKRFDMEESAVKKAYQRYKNRRLNGHLG